MDYKYFEFRNLKTRGEVEIFLTQVRQYAYFVQERLFELLKNQDQKRFLSVLREAHAVYHLRCLALEKIVNDQEVFKEKKAISLGISLCRLMSFLWQIETPFFRDETYSILEKFSPKHNRFADSLAIIWSLRWNRRIKTDDMVFWRLIGSRNNLPSLYFEEDIFCHEFQYTTHGQSRRTLDSSITLTNSQIRALDDLSWIYKAWQNRKKLPSIISPSLHGLIIGSSGSGKSYLIHRWAEQKGLAVFSISMGSWLVMGSRSEVPTLKKIAQWVTTHFDGIIVIDELEKINPKSAHAEYSRYIVDEVMSLLDGRVQHLEGWGQATATALKNYFIVTVATFQDYYAEQIKDGIHFAEQWENISIRDKILSQDRLPQELIFRLSSKIIEIAPPSAEEIAARIHSIHKELQLPELTPDQEYSIAQKIVKNKKNMRGVEEYALEKWIEVTKTREADEQIKIDPPEEKE